MGSKLISVIVSLMVVLGLSLVPAVPVALAQPFVIGANVTPASQVVGPGASFSVYLWLIDDAAQAHDTVAWRLTYNTSLVTATAITVNPYFQINLLNDFNNSWDPANNTGEIRSDNGWLGSNRTVTNWSCYVNFTANGTNQGTTPLNFIYIPIDTASDVFLGGVSLLNWSLVTNGSVTVSSGATCCANMTGNGNVTVDGQEFAPPGGCKQDGNLNHTFTLLATPDPGWVFTKWSDNVDGANTTNPNNITITGGATDTVTATFTALPPQACVNTSVIDFGILPVGGSNPANKSVAVINCGGGQLNWSVTGLNYDAGNPNASWAGISYSPANGGPLGNGSSETVEVAVDIQGETATGTYNAIMSINPNVTITFYLQPATEINPCRNITLPGGLAYIYAGQSFNVNVSWVTCNNTVNGLGLIDNTSVTNATGTRFYWDSVVQTSESPAATNKTVRGGGNTSVEYAWEGNINGLTPMWVSYSVTVTPGTAPGWYNMTVCPDNTTAWIEYYIGETPYVNCIGCQFQIFVAAPVYIEGTVYEVVYNWFRPGYDGNPGNLTLLNVNVTMKDTTTNSSITNAAGYYNISVAPGSYILNASLAGFATETYGAVNITGLEVGPVVVNFIGVNGLEPSPAPFYTPRFALSYTLRATNCWLVTPAAMPAAALTGTEVLNVTNLWLATP